MTEKEAVDLLEQTLEAARNKVLQDLLLQCSTDEQLRFAKIFPNGVKESDIKGAVRLIARTIQHNKKQTTQEG
jgi:hypothetical protein